MTQEPQLPPPWVNGPEIPPEQVAESSDRDERRLVATVVRLVMRLPRAARWALLAAALAGAGDATGVDDALLEAIFSSPPVEVTPRAPSRATKPDLRLERADLEALNEAR